MNERLINSVLAPVGLRVVRTEPRPKPWDYDFLGWIKEAEAFLKEYRRVLRPGGVVAFNFDTIMSEAGFRWFLETPPQARSIFKFYHPEMVKKLVEARGYEVALFTSANRFASIELRKPANG